jgi:hypothetical protein
MTDSLMCPVVEKDRDTGDLEACGAATYRATALCARHYHRLGDDLATIDRVLRWIGDDPDGWLTRPVTDHAPGHTSRQGSPAPGRIDVMSATDRRTLAMVAVHGWARDVAQTGRALDRVESARILLAHHETIASHPALPEIVDELHSAAKELQALCDEHWNTAEQDARPRDLGGCRQPHPSEPGRRCPGRRHWRPGTISTFCDYCGHTEEGDGWITRRMAIAVFGISERTLYRWISIGLVATLDRHVYTDDIRAAVRLRHADTGNAEGA